MLTRREFIGYPKVASLIALMVILIAALIMSIVASITHVQVTDDLTSAESSFLQTFGLLGMPVFAAATFFIGSLIPKVLKRKGAVELVLDENALVYGAIKISWPVIREATVCRSFGRSYIGIRTGNDRAVIRKMNEVVFKRVPSILLLGYRYHLWRTKCALLIPAMQSISLVELQSLIEQYRGTYSSGRVPEVSMPTTPVASS
ncbi:MAG TPA: hypothetical protein VFL13_12465 [Candidatus Baltobacteraceae bacterium]|nr:hypothetical protein [Candidatus Baltobacteraceae bacterium]